MRGSQPLLPPWTCNAELCLLQRWAKASANRLKYYGCDRRFFCLNRRMCCAGAAGLANKLDAVIHILLLEVGWSDNPLNDLSSYSQQVINNCSDQGSRGYVQPAKGFKGGGGGGGGGGVCVCFTFSGTGHACFPGVEYEIAQAPAVDLPALLSERAADLQSRGTVPALADDVQYNALCDDAAEVGQQTKLGGGSCSADFFDLACSRCLVQIRIQDPKTSWPILSADKACGSLHCATRTSDPKTLWQTSPVNPAPLSGCTCAGECRSCSPARRRGSGNPGGRKSRAASGGSTIPQFLAHRRCQARSRQFALGHPSVYVHVPRLHFRVRSQSVCQSVSQSMIQSMSVIQSADYDHAR